MPDTRAIFARHQLRCTQQRLALYETLIATHTHPTAEELFELTGGNGHSDLSMATVYNALEAFCQAGLCQKLAGLNGSCRYDADLHDHLHFKDMRTGEVRDVPDEIGDLLLESIPPEVIKSIEKKMGMQLHRISVEFIGEAAKS